MIDLKKISSNLYIESYQIEEVKDSETKNLKIKIVGDNSEFLRGHIFAFNF